MGIQMNRIFDYTGFDEDLLLSLCGDSHVKRGFAPWKYWTAEIYSFGRHYRNYGYYPSFLPIYCYSAHGVDYNTKKPYPHEIDNYAYAMLHVSPVAVELYKEYLDKPCYCVHSPFVWCRKSNKIGKADDARGTLAFPAHSTPVIDVEMDYGGYADLLLSLPEEFFPVAVCLHMHDINKGLHKIFQRKCIPVYTAGNAEDMRFAQRWYDIARNYAYTTSNVVGSYTFYSVEMGIPFFIMGNYPKLINFGDRNIPEGEYTYADKDYMAAHELFSERVDSVTPEQRAFVEKHLGIHDGLSRKEFSKLLYTAYLHKGNIVKDLFALGKYQGKNFARPLYRFAKRVLSTCRNAWGAGIDVVRAGVPLWDVAKLAWGEGHMRFSLLGKRLETNSPFWTLHGIREIFVDKTYLFNTSEKSPRIIDCGANIGLSTVHFKLKHPHARVTALEPDPAICGMLERNVSAFGFTDVEVLCKAAWTDDAGVSFINSGGVGGRIDASKDCGDTTPSIRLRDLLQEPVDFLKIDIEGAEYEVLKDCADSLKNVRNLFIEYHSMEKDEQQLDQILKFLKSTGFRYYIKEAWNNQPHPFTNKRCNLYDLQLNLFAYRIGCPQ
ncbi:FkbM family methyltransferase [Desulfocurvibacter africanus]